MQVQSFSTSYGSTKQEAFTIGPQDHYCQKKDVEKSESIRSDHTISLSSSTQTNESSIFSSVSGSINPHEIAIIDSNNLLCYSIPLKKCKSSKDSTSNIQRALKNSSDAVLFNLGFYKNPVFASSISSVTSVGSASATEASSLLSLLSLHQEATEANPKVKVVKRNSSHADMRLSMISNLSAAYNTINISLVLTMMKSLHPVSNPSDISICSSSMIAGMIIGQLGGGLLGDWLGRHVAMSVVMSLQVVAAFWSAWAGLLSTSDSVSTYTVLARCRFLLGVGCGGVYPLAATITAESSSDKQDRGKLVALTFSMQGIGYLSVPLVAYALVWILGERSDLAWRLLLGFGCIPGLALIVMRNFQRKVAVASKSTHKTETKLHGATEEISEIKCQQTTDERSTKNVRLEPNTLLHNILREPNLVSKIIGTAGCWFIFDILFYGNALFQPIVLRAAFGKSESVLATVRDSAVISMIALPGYFVSVYLIGRQTPKKIQLQGFLVMAILYAIIGMKFSSLTFNKLAMVSMYGLTFFFSNYGPNSTTFMLPSITFSRPCRSTLNGICAASGKLGALMGSMIFLPLAAWLGNDKVMLVCSLMSVIGACMTLFLEDSAELNSREQDTGRVHSEVHTSLHQKTDSMSSHVPKMVQVGSIPSFFDCA